jgi:hypothetical protein
MADVFISFIHEEQAVAVAVQHLLEARLGGNTVFLSADQWQVHAGEIWLERIRQELDQARIVILMLSADSVGRPWVNFEAGAAWLAGKVVIPVCYGGLSPNTLPKPYSGIQAVNLRDGGYYLVRSVAHHLGRIAPPPADYEHFGPGSELHRALDDVDRRRGEAGRP